MPLSFFRRYCDVCTRITKQAYQVTPYIAIPYGAKPPYRRGEHHARVCLTCLTRWTK